MSFQSVNTFLLQFLPQEIVWKVLFTYGGFSPYPYMGQLKESKNKIFNKLKCNEEIINFGGVVLEQSDTININFEITAYEYKTFFDKDFTGDWTVNIEACIYNEYYNDIALHEDFEFILCWSNKEKDYWVEKEETPIKFKVSSIIASKIRQRLINLQQLRIILDRLN